MQEKIIMSVHREGYNTDQISNTMTVGELIEWLGHFNENAKIYTSHDNGYTFGGICKSHFKEDWETDE